MFSRDLNPIRALRNANDLRIPHAPSLGFREKIPSLYFPQQLERRRSKKRHPDLQYLLQAAEKVGTGLASLVA